MSRIVLVDDSQSARELLAARLRADGHEVRVAREGVEGAELALRDPPDAVVTDLWMPGLSGVQLCRLLKSEEATRHVPVILLTSASDRRTRFWARSAGAAAYVDKNDSAPLLGILRDVIKHAPTLPPAAMPPVQVSGVHERLSAQLDLALFESVVAGEVRSLAQADGDIGTLFSSLTSLASEITAYRWLALVTGDPARFYVHAHSDDATACEAEARAALLGPSDEHVEANLITDDRAIVGRASPALVAPIAFGARDVGRLALGPGPRGASTEDRKLVSLLGGELGGPLQIVTLVNQARQLAMVDPLTGLMNRRAFVDAMERETARVQRYDVPLSLLLLDIDRFKGINDTRGHGAGDVVLRGVGRVLRRISRKTDLVARWGGEEFVVALPLTGAAGARVAAERLRRAIADEVHVLDGGETLHATASIGMATAERNETYESLVARADQGMYAAKSRGRNRVESVPRADLPAPH